VGETGAQVAGVVVEIGDQVKAVAGDIMGNRKPHHVGYDKHDQKWNAKGAEFGDMFDTYFDKNCQELVDEFLDGTKKLSDFFPDFFEAGPAGP
jgi:hypothetical protein